MCAAVYNTQTIVYIATFRTFEENAVRHPGPSRHCVCVCVYTLSRYRHGNYYLALFSGPDIQMHGFAFVVQTLLNTPSGVPGATGRCFSMQFKTKQDLDQATGGLTYSCFNCGAVSPTLKMCQGCEFTRYCSKRCQIMCWKKSHKEECPQISFDR